MATKNFNRTFLIIIIKCTIFVPQANYKMLQKIFDNGDNSVEKLIETALSTTNQFHNSRGVIVA